MPDPVFWNWNWLIIPALAITVGVIAEGLGWIMDKIEARRYERQHPGWKDE